MKKTVVCEKCGCVMLDGWHPKSKKRRVLKKHKKRQKHFHFEGTITETDVSIRVKDIKSVPHLVRGRTKNGIVFDFPLFIPGVPNANGTIYPDSPKNIPIEPILINSKEEFDILFGEPNRVSMGCTYHHNERSDISNSHILTDLNGKFIDILEEKHNWMQREFDILEDQQMKDLISTAVSKGTIRNGKE